MRKRVNGSEVARVRDRRFGDVIEGLSARPKGFRTDRKSTGIDRYRGLDRRAQTRLHLLDVEASSPAIHFVLLDVSPFGMSVETPQPLRIGERYPIRIRHKRATVTVDGLVRWCRLNHTREVSDSEFESIYRAGFALESIAPEQPTLSDLATLEPEPEPVSGRYLFVAGDDGLTRQK